MYDHWDPFVDDFLFEEHEQEEDGALEDDDGALDDEAAHSIAEIDAYVEEMNERLSDAELHDGERPDEDEEYEEEYEEEQTCQ